MNVCYSAEDLTACLERAAEVSEEHPVVVSAFLHFGFYHFASNMICLVLYGFDLENRLGIPSIELTRLYQIDRIAAQYDALAAALGVRFDYDAFRDRAKESMKRFRQQYPGAVFSVGEAINADPFELALALVRYGFKVREIFGTLTTDSYRYIRHLAVLSPETRVYSNLSPTMLRYREEISVDEKEFPIALGRDAGWYHPDIPCLLWGQDIQPFGFMGVSRFFDALSETARAGEKNLFGSSVRLGGENEAGRLIANVQKTFAVPECEGRGDEAQVPRGYRKILTPFAPDQSGADNQDAALRRDCFFKRKRIVQRHEAEPFLNRFQPLHRRHKRR